ncbi:MAG: hypothetical protein ACW99A_17600 [Candidatus Kariarchaeaceae archaeon]|jgi:hypothetical protein
MPQSDELVELVKAAKEFETQNKLKEAKHGFLDAASFALNLSKTSERKDKISYELIARELLNYAKDLQLEILLDSQGFPSPPGSVPSGISQKSDGSATESVEEIKSKTELTKIFQLMIVKTGGIPLCSYEFEELPNSTQLKLNEILFTGAITAVNQLMEEILEKAVQTIRFEGGVLMIHTHKKLQFILFAKEEDEKLFSYLKLFSNNFVTIFKADINESARTGSALIMGEKLEKMIHTTFQFSRNE